MKILECSDRTEPFRPSLSWQRLSQLGRLSLALLLLAAAGIGCSRPQHDGPHLTKIPEGFFFDRGSQPFYDFFPGEYARSEGAWVRMMFNNDHATIHIVEYDFVADTLDIEDAHFDFLEYYANEECSDLESFDVDGQPAWGWSRLQWWKGDLEVAAYIAVIPFPENTFVVAATSSIEGFKDAEELREVVGSFRLPRERGVLGDLVRWGLLLVGFGIVLWVVRGMQKAT